MNYSGSWRVHRGNYFTRGGIYSGERMMSELRGLHAMGVHESGFESRLATFYFSLQQ